MECYICYDKETKSNPFCNYQPCKCKGTNKIHESCFEKLRINCGNKCSICKSIYSNKNNINNNVTVNVKNYSTSTNTLYYYQKEIIDLELNYIFRDDPELLEYAKQLSGLESYKKSLIKDSQKSSKCKCIIS
jgi:hypothetical protein